MHYFTGKPCKYGHIDIRFTSTGQCVTCINAHSKNWRKENRPKLRAGEALYKINNPEKVKQWKQTDYKKNRQKYLDRLSSYRIKNPEKINVFSAMRRAAKRSRVPKWFGEFDAFVWNEAARLAMVRNKATGLIWHADHMIPMRSSTASGLHVASNCQVIPAVLNLSKQSKMVLTEPYEWIACL